jgi:hypothetical protein
VNFVVDTGNSFFLSGKPFVQVMHQATVTVLLPDCLPKPVNVSKNMFWIIPITLIDNIVRCADNTLYFMITTELKSRVGGIF